MTLMTVHHARSNERTHQGEQKYGEQKEHFGDIVVDLQARHLTQHLASKTVQQMPQVSSWRLDLSCNSLDGAHFIPACVVELDLSFNHLRTLEDFWTLCNLRSLNLKNNALVSLLGLANNTQLEVLQVSHNQLKSINGIENLSELCFLDAQHNQLSSIRTLSLNAGLKELNVSLGNNRLPPIAQLRRMVMDMIPSIEILDGKCMPPSPAASRRSRREISYAYRNYLAVYANTVQMKQLTSGDTVALGQLTDMSQDARSNSSSPTKQSSWSPRGNDVQHTSDVNLNTNESARDTKEPRNQYVNIEFETKQKEKERPSLLSPTTPVRNGWHQSLRSSPKTQRQRSRRASWNGSVYNNCTSGRKTVHQENRASNERLSDGSGSETGSDLDLQRDFRNETNRRRNWGVVHECDEPIYESNRHFYSSKLETADDRGERKLTIHDLVDGSKSDVSAFAERFPYVSSVFEQPDIDQPTSNYNQNHQFCNADSRPDLNHQPQFDGSAQRSQSDQSSQLGSSGGSVGSVRWGRCGLIELGKNDFMGVNDNRKNNKNNSNNRCTSTTSPLQQWYHSDSRKYVKPEWEEEEEEEEDAGEVKRQQEQQRKSLRVLQQRMRLNQLTEIISSKKNSLRALASVLQQFDE